MHRPGNLPLYFLLAYSLLLVACGTANPRDPVPPLPLENRATEKCPGIYIFASSRHAVNLVAAKEVVIYPETHPIPVYCTPAQARAALKEARSSGTVPASMDLLVYLLDGRWRDMVRKDGDKHFLYRPAILLEVVE